MDEPRRYVEPTLPIAKVRRSKPYYILGLVALALILMCMIVGLGAMLFG